jgi:uncharacterized protein (TIGR02001 family)
VNSDNLVRWGMPAALFLAACAPAHAQSPETESEATGPIDVSANVGVVSDYRFRGLSYSDKDPAIQGGIDVSHESGFFVGTWASSIADVGAGNVEIDLYGGYGGSTGPVEYKVTALGYFYPGGSGQNYFELMGAVDVDTGPASVGLTGAWVPDQSNYGGENFYVSARTAVPVGDTGASLFGHVGYEDGDAYDGKWDWEAGVSVSSGPVTASLSYVDTNYSGPEQAGRLGQAGVVISLIATF